MLIEKDYYCSVLLCDMAPLFEAGLVFKGGTCLSKVHAEFFRLSEDLDFAISVRSDAPAANRRQAAGPVKDHFTTLPKRRKCFREVEPLSGHNSSRQYNGRYSYRSVVTGEEEFVKVEISLRELILLPSEQRQARTLLLDPHSSGPAFPLSTCASCHSARRTPRRCARR